MEIKRRLLQVALHTRLFLIVLQFVSNRLIPDHDAHVFLYPKVSSTPTALDNFIQGLFGGFLNWDAQYFMHIAKYGYTYENTTAFFPLLPFLARYLALLVHFDSLLSFDSTLLLIFLLINIVSFILAVFALFELTKEMYSEKYAFIASVLFCLNPASIFFMAPYTECLFSYLSFKSMLNSVKLYKKYLKFKEQIQVSDLVCLTPICLSGLTRSNGILNIVNFMVMIGCLMINRLQNMSKFSEIFYVILSFFFIGLFCGVFCLLPFIIYQYYCYNLFCTDFHIELPLVVSKFAVENGLVLPGKFSLYNQTWCSKSIPLAYSYVQEHYWNVGFFKYYELKQVPNFILAFPVITLVLMHINKYIDIIYPFKLFLKLARKHIECSVFIFGCHAILLTLFCMFFVHIQVTTRMLCSASPILYWNCTDYFFTRKNNPIKSGHNICDMIFKGTFCYEQKLVMLYFLSFLIIGTVLFSNFFPWT